MLHSFYYGWLCFLGNTPSAHDRDDDLNFYVSCHDSLWLILGYVLSTFLVLTCLNVVLERYSQGVPRLLCAAIVGAFVVLWVYDAHFAQFQPSPYIFGGSVGAVDLLALVLVVVGNDVYGRDPEPDVELITHYTPPTPSRTSSMNSNTSASSSGPSAEFVALTKEAKNMAMHN
ncbi:hypothetical protein EON65_00910 [archaeon]|nr:MAG: hypothetical protein EON65_00910 [archaeon]